MKRWILRILGLALLLLFVIKGYQCATYDRGKAVVSLVMRGQEVKSARDIKYEDGGLREQVDEVFFFADPSELKEAVQKAGFVRDETVVVRDSSAFSKLSSGVNRSSALGYRRSDFTMKNGKYCHLICAPDFTWAYAIFVDSGNS